MSRNKPCNHLSDSTSPYLLQHAHNPVQWYPWGPEALQKARDEDKPVLLSIGYSACHWCHVMAHESFEDEQTAELMNRLFINIKVDREERPDLDKIYQTAHQLLTQRSGGWPLTMFLMPEDHVPFFGGTYFPPKARYNMPSFADVMTQVEQYYRTQMGDLEQQNSSVMSALKQFTQKTLVECELNAMPLDMARQQMEKSFDTQYGGFGSAPKFPHPTNIERLLRHWAASGDKSRLPGESSGKNLSITKDETSLSMALQTLHAMASGGLYDQLGGGFCRYSVDDKWEIPHFEKMLYDNGPLLSLYCRAYQVTQNPVFKRIALETADWVLREMQSPEGGYYSTLDADSEGEEGKFYAWTPQEVKQALKDEKQYQVVEKFYGLDGPANFEGKWHFCVRRTPQDISVELKLDERYVLQLLSEAKQKLLLAREQRIRPGRDEKILTSWNGLMIKGMAEAGRIFNEEKYSLSATRALNFIRAKLWVDGGLLATCKDNNAHLMAYLDDYVFLIDGILELLQVRWNTAELEFAVDLVECVLNKFEDKEQGGFFFTGSDHEQLLMRLKPLADDALPSGNGVAASVLIRMAHMLGEDRYAEAAERVLIFAWDDINQTPYVYNALLVALEQLLYPGEQIVIRGESVALEDCLDQLNEVRNKQYQPALFILAIPADEKDLPGMLDNYRFDFRTESNLLAYYCRGVQCNPPVSGVDEIINLLA